MLFKGNANEPDLENFSASGKESIHRIVVVVNIVIQKLAVIS